MRREMAKDKVIIIGKHKLLPRKVAAEKLGIVPLTLRRMELDKTGPAVVRIARDIYYRESDLEKWIETQATA
jgi:hypothetical protein